MSQTENIKELITALSKAQGSMKPAVFNKVNPHYKSKYADFASCMDACRNPLAENGIVVTQYCELLNDKLNLVTMLAHTSGQWMTSYFPVFTANNNMQSLGSAISYAKRYALTAALGIVADEEVDDDAEAADGRNNPPQEYKKTQAPVKQKVQAVPQRISSEQVNALKSLEEKLDKECKVKIYSWLMASHKIDKFEDVNVDIFAKVQGALENAVKYVEQQKLEVVNA